MSYIPNPFIIPIGVIAGILLSMPFGPVNLLGLQRAVERGFFGGMAAGLGIMLGDGLIALGAALGVQSISGALRDYRTLVQIVGGLALLIAGLRLYYAPVTISTDVAADKIRYRDYIGEVPQMFLLTITNPGAVLSGVAIYGGVSTFVEVESHIDALTMVAAVMGGSFLYWFFVCEWISRVRNQIDSVKLSRINRIAGLILIGFGGVLIGEMAVKRLRFW